jgi:hypothetical protein
MAPARETSIDQVRLLVESLGAVLASQFAIGEGRYDLPAITRDWSTGF